MRDYKELKRLRWIRNSLVHETDSFEENLISVEDIKWLHTFYHRIMECTDPFSLLHQMADMDERKGTKEKPSLLQNERLLDKKMILAGVILVVIGLVIFGIIFFEVIEWTKDVLFI